MASEFETPGDEAETIDLGDGSGDGADTSTDEQAAEGDAAGDQPAAGAGINPSTGKTFTQSEVDAIVQRRLAEDRRRRGATQGRPAVPTADTTRETPRFDPATEAALRAYLEPTLAPLRAQQVEIDIERAVNAASAKYPDFAENKDAIIDLVLSWGEDIVNRAPMNWLLEQGYLQHKYANFDEKAFRAKVEAEYVAGKAKTARTAPSLQGSGGKASIAPRAKEKKGDWRSADQQMRALIEEGASSV